MKNLRVLSLIIMAMIVFSFVACNIADNNEGELKVGEFYVDGNGEYTSLIVRYEDGTKAASKAATLEKYGKVKVREMSNGRDMAIVDIKSNDLNPKVVMEELKADPAVKYVEPNYIMKAFLTPNDTYYQYQWHMAQLNMPAAWDIEMGETSVKVAVLDTGIAYDLDDISGTAFDLTNDKDFVNNDMDSYDDNAHGTHCAGTIAQTTNNGNGVTGMAPGITLLPLKVLSAEGSGATDGIASAVIWAADHGADIISMSLGGGGYSQTMYDACEYAYNNGVTIFAASGNDGSGTVSYPAAYNEWIIAVGATRYDKARTSYSQYGSALDIVAPGGDTSVDQDGDGYVDGVLQQTITGYSNGSTDYTPGYFFFQGTSMATPHAAGLGAMLKSHNPNATPAMIRDAIQNSAEDLGTNGWDQYYGHGLIDPVAALNYIGGTTPTEDTTAPTVSINGPAETTTATIDVTLTGSDNVGITGWAVKEDSTATPTSWTATAPTTFTLSSEGTHTIYAWAKDAAGNISAYDYFTVTYTADNGGGTGSSVFTTDTINDTLNYNRNRTDEWFIDVAEGVIDIELTFSTSDSNDMDLYLYDPAGNQVASSEGTTGTEVISYNAGSNAGQYKIAVYMYYISWWRRNKSKDYTLAVEWYAPAE